ncbi:hypothetical protein M2273_001676 [Mucilaginibacter lappiensis]|jgi:hypothetical protein
MRYIGKWLIRVTYKISIKSRALSFQLFAYKNYLAEYST